MREVTAVLRDALVVVVACSGTALAFNALRPGGIRLIQEEPYQILVPCPDATGDAEAIRPDAPALREPQVLLIDARPRAQFGEWHLPAATSVPYDYLEPTTPSTLNRITGSGAKRVIVYGDGADPDSGEQLARELAGKGIRNVGFVVGGAAALKSAQAVGRSP